MSDLKKLLDKAKKNYAIQQEKFQKAADSFVDLRVPVLPPKKAETPVVKQPASGSLASAVSAIRNNHLKNVAKKVEILQKAKSLKEKEAQKKAAEPKNALGSQTPKTESHNKILQKAPIKKVAPTMDFQKLMEVAQRNTAKGSTNGAAPFLRKEVDQIVKQAVQSSSQKPPPKQQLSSARMSAPAPAATSSMKKIPLKHTPSSISDPTKLPKKNINSASVAAKASLPLKKSVSAQNVTSRKLSSASQTKLQNTTTRPSGSAVAPLFRKTPSVASNAVKTVAKLTVSNRSVQIVQRTATKNVAEKQNRLPVSTVRKAKPVLPSTSKNGPLLPHLPMKKPLPPADPSKSYDNGREPLLPFLERALPAKRKQLPSDYVEEEDSDLDGFIVSDDEVEGAEDLPSSKKLRNMIREITGYDPSQYIDDEDDDDRNMESSYKEIAREEAISAKLGLKEDLEDMRLELEKEKKKKLKKVSLAKKLKLS